MQFQELLWYGFCIHTLASSTSKNHGYIQINDLTYLYISVTPICRKIMMCLLFFFWWKFHIVTI